MKFNHIRDEVVRLQGNHPARPPEVENLLAPYTDRAVILGIKQQEEGINVNDFDALVSIPDAEAIVLLLRIKEIYAALPK